jgi:GAF domain-containing protein
LVAISARQIEAIQHDAFVMREDALDTRLRAWLARLNHAPKPPTREQTLSWALDAALSVEGADYANIQIVCDGGRSLAIVAERGFRNPFLDFFALVDNAETACGVALLEHRPVFVADINDSAIFARTDGLEIMLQAGVRSVRTTPIVTNAGSVVGMLSVHYKKPQSKEETRWNRLQTVAGAVALAID